MSFKEYYEKEWRLKLNRPEYATIERRWRSRWDFAVNNINDNSKVLDVACGDGVLGELLTIQKKCKVSGIDLCEYAIDISRKKGVDAKYCDISCEVYPYGDNEFDYVTMLCCLEHIIDPVHAIKEALRVVKVGGGILITLPNAVNIKNRIQFLFGQVPVDLLHIKEGEGMHIQFYNYKDEFERRVLDNFFEDCAVQLKQGDLKNPKEYSSFMLAVYSLLIKINPNLFSEYGSWFILKK